MASKTHTETNDEPHVVVILESGEMRIAYTSDGRPLKVTVVEVCPDHEDQLTHVDGIGSEGMDVWTTTYDANDFRENWDAREVAAVAAILDGSLQA